MKLSLLSQPSAPLSVCPFHLVDEQGAELAWANAFLDAQRIRQLSRCSLRAYAYDLLHLARWLDQTQQALANSINPSCSTMFASSSIISPHPRRRPSTIVWACCAVCIASITDARFRPGSPISAAPIGRDHLSATVGRNTGSPAVCDCGSPNA